ncbi:peptidylprolyl isomerase [Enterococcus raffinosus]|jgi:foldase protein PrsA|uniref:Foldase protein PrsA n=1 Tax=Enterococcus raffinosus TaxID=71452 RepID=A0AAP5K8G9_9ENTE|nr:peptidylprolyl isomerase [Enterococcus raffinosus]MDT2521795.1 peptidylprolyl isomerase [Enterococcus raffinosus]MDT2529104.1 peptidylprolyl isomerase [Enterococcus raffinosus]MDT2532690.1 peptidylprolyl isomerase [Enterococcus raffinosus]MDT2544443.1 peptidylprolyl isomerase [Enterococcus raffinosus]MDT2554733.1 peptidylprolyl isomerase [Enterococcus raffinosus]
MKKKILLATAGLLSVVVLGACSGSSNQDIATMKGGKITVEDFYNEAKKEQTNQSLVRNMIIYKVFENAYGDKVTDKQIDKEYDKQAKQLGDSFESQLKSAGYTKKSYKEYLKQSLAFQEGLKSHVKITDKDLKSAWDSFHPEVTARIILASSEDEAKEIKKQLDDKGDFAKIAKEKSQDSTTKEDGGEIKFDSQSSTVPSEVKEAAFKLKNGEVSDVITAMDSSTYQSSYYIVKMEKNSSKGNDMDKYKKELKQIAEDTKMADQTFSSEVIAKELKKANVKIKDDSFENILSDFLTTNSSSKKATTESTK